MNCPGCGRESDLVGTAEAAEILDVERPRISLWLRRGRMPEPVARLHAGPIWTRDQIEAMLDEATGRARLRVRDASIDGRVRDRGEVRAPESDGASLAASLAILRALPDLLS